jgi:hypothetical protein
MRCVSVFYKLYYKSGEKWGKIDNFRPSAAPAKFSCICTVELAELNAQKTSPYAIA